MISIKGLNKFYNKGERNQLHVLKNVTLDLPEKGMVAVFGRSGCGKTTLLNVVGGLDSFASGQILFDGKALKSDPDVIRNRDIGYIFQNYYLNYQVNCFENVSDALRLCGVEDRALLRERTMAALTLVGMEKYAMRLPDTLSGGQQQRIAIARAIVKSPKVILADEPTGNLDEANTLLIMDLLKDLSKDRLVLLVTHEAELVDHYCDKVIEIKDGRIENIKENDGAYGLIAKSKNVIYLGEYDKQNEQSANLSIDYYGSCPTEPLRLRFISKDGKSYLQVLTSGVQVLDENSEIKVNEGVFESKREQHEEEKQTERKFDFAPLEGGRYGRLFTFGSSLLAGYRLHFTKMQKKGRRLLVCTLLLLSLILVMTASTFGTAFSDIFTMNRAYNKYTFELLTSDPACYTALQGAVGREDAAIDYVFSDVKGYFSSPSLSLGAFETSEQNRIDISSADAILPVRMAEGRDLVCGRLPERDDEVLLSSLTAERILEDSTVDFIKKPEDLINNLITGLISSDYSGGVSLKVVGVVKAKETAFYLTERALAKAALPTYVAAGDDYGVPLGEGQVALYLPFGAPGYAIGEEITLNGKTLKIGALLTPDDLDTEKMPRVEVYDDLSGLFFKYPSPFGTEYMNKGAGFFLSDEDLLSVACSSGTSSLPVKGTNLATGDYYQQTIIIHSTSPKKTEKFLEEEMASYLTDGYLFTPDDEKNAQAFFDISSIISKFVSMGVLGLITCLCIFFIMRSSLMGRVKEVGIYRAIGVSKKNIVFRFFAESLALSSLTVGAGTVLTSALVLFWLDYAPSMEEMFFYPPWLALIVIAFAMGVSVIFGILPALFLLMKTPSAILSKYDI
ncbi:MAG: ABC transporter ATP-binding protein/permease [Clostridia bacterium]|nr:ABC transporter ATP-binding protein/permease [Clostridia bacterium]